jgi:Family of unknown function (DUF6311)
MLSKSNSLILLAYIFLLLFIETLCATDWTQGGDMYTLSIAYVVSGVLLSFLPLLKIQISSPSPQESLKTVSKLVFKILKGSHLLIWGFIALFCIPIVKTYFTEVPIFYKNADMIPILKIQAQRFLKFEDVYTVIPEIWGGMKPIYLTFLWLPFSISEYFGFDARWIVMGGMAFGLFFIFKIFQRSKVLAPSVLALLGLFFILNFMVNHDKGTIIFAEEGVVVGYYLFLGYALSRKNAWLIGFGIAFCVLSRYLLVFWLPVFWLYWFFFESRKGAWIILGVSASLFLATFLIPYGIKNIELLTGQHKGYIEMARRTWMTNPDFTKNTMGLAKFFTVEKIELLHTLLISFSALIPLVFGGIFLLLRSKKWFQPEMFALCSLKLSMVCFYNLLEMPYPYLFYTNTFFSYCLVFYYFTLIETRTENLGIRSFFIRFMTFFKAMKINPLYAVLGLSLVFFLLKFGINVLDFTNTNWVYRLSFDPGSELIAFNNYRHTPWSFPIIGRLEGGDYPTVTGIGMTQSVALLAVLFKTLSAWLPVDFQYFGWWYLLCFLLQGWFGLKLIKNISDFGFRISDFDSVSTTETRQPTSLHVLATIFFIIAPPFLFRSGHIVLFSHFFIVAALSLYFSSDTPQRKFKYALLLMATAAGVSQYMAAMTFSIVGMSFVDTAWRRLMPVYKGFLQGLACLAVAFLMFYIMGATLIPSDNYQTFGFGTFSANLNTFFNSLDDTSILPRLPLSNPNQYEGFGYLGLGFILLSLFVIGYSVFGNRYLLSVNRYSLTEIRNSKPETRNPKLAPLLFIMFLFFIYALSCKIGFNDTLLYEWQYGSTVAVIFETLRGSGRFIWIPFYGIMVLVFISFYKLKLSNTWKTALLSLFLMLQIVDIQKLMTLEKDIFERCSQDDCPHYKWRQLFREASRVIMFTPYAWDFKKSNDFYPFCRAASEEGKAITTGYFARRHAALVKDYENKLYKDWSENRLSENDKAIFVGSKNKLWHFQKLVESGQLQCFEYEGYAILVPPALTNTLNQLSKLQNCKPLPFYTEGVADFLQKHSKNTIFVTVSEEATYKLDHPTREAFKKTGATAFAKLGFAGSYMSIIHKGKTLFEQVAGQGIAIEKTFEKGEILRGANAALSIDKKLQLASCGDVAHKMSKTLLDGKEYSLYKRGINFVAVNDKLELIESTYFDTYEETSHAVFK